MSAHQDGDEGAAGRNGREQYPPRQGVIDLPSRLISEFLQKRKQTKIFSCQTWRSPLEIVSDPSKDGLDALQMALTLLES